MVGVSTMSNIFCLIWNFLEFRFYWIMHHHFDGTPIPKSRTAWKHRAASAWRQSACIEARWFSRSARRRRRTIHVWPLYCTWLLQESRSVRNLYSAWSVFRKWIYISTGPRKHLLTGKNRLLRSQLRHDVILPSLVGFAREIKWLSTKTPRFLSWIAWRSVYCSIFWESSWKKSPF